MHRPGRIGHGRFFFLYRMLGKQYVLCRLAYVAVKRKRGAMITRRTGQMLAWLAVVIGLLLPGVGLAQSKSYVYKRIDVLVDVQKNGKLDVTETYTYHFTGGPFGRGERRISKQRLDSISIASLSESNAAYTEASRLSEPGTFTVDDTGRDVQVRWQFAATTDADRTFSLRYTVDGAVRVNSNNNQIWWVAVFPDRTVSVQESRIRFSLPPDIDPNTVDVSLPEADGTVSREENVITVARTAELRANEQLDVQVAFPLGQLDVTSPDWQRNSGGSSNSVGDPPEKIVGDVLANGGWVVAVILGGLFAFTTIRRLITGDVDDLQSTDQRQRARARRKRRRKRRSGGGGRSGGSGGGGGGAS